MIEPPKGAIDGDMTYLDIIEIQNAKIDVYQAKDAFSDPKQAGWCSVSKGQRIIIMYPNKFYVTFVASENDPAAKF